MHSSPDPSQKRYSSAEITIDFQSVARCVSALTNNEAQVVKEHLQGRTCRTFQLQSGPDMVVAKFCRVRAGENNPFLKEEQYLKLANRLGMRVPAAIGCVSSEGLEVARSDQLFYCFVQEYIEASSFAAITSPVLRAHVWSQVGEELKTFHSCLLTEADESNALQWWRLRLLECDVALNRNEKVLQRFGVDCSKLRKVIESFAYRDMALVPCHYDVTASNILVHNKSLRAILDFGLAGPGVKCVGEFSTAFRNVTVDRAHLFPFQRYEREALLEGYGTSFKDYDWNESSKQFVLRTLSFINTILDRAKSTDKGALLLLDELRKNSNQIDLS